MARWRVEGSSYHSMGENVVSQKLLKFIFGLEKEKNIIKNPLLSCISMMIRRNNGELGWYSV